MPADPASPTPSRESDALVSRLNDVLYKTGTRLPHETILRLAEWGEWARHEGAEAARENAAKHCDDLAEMMENGAGEDRPGHRLRQAARNIRSKP